MSKSDENPNDGVQESQLFFLFFGHFAQLNGGVVNSTDLFAICK